MTSTDQPSVRLIREADAYHVFINGERVDEVYRARYRTDRYPYAESQLRYRGRWRWRAGRIRDEDFATRREAVTETVRRQEGRRG